MRPNETAGKRWREHPVEAVSNKTIDISLSCFKFAELNFFSSGSVVDNECVCVDNKEGHTIPARSAGIEKLVSDKRNYRGDRISGSHLTHASLP